MTDLAAVYGKNLVLRRCVCWEPGENGAIRAYVHSDYLTEGKASVLVEAVVSRPKALVHPVFQRLLKNSALQQGTERTTGEWPTAHKYATAAGKHSKIPISNAKSLAREAKTATASMTPTVLYRAGSVLRGESRRQRLRYASRSIPAKPSQIKGLTIMRAKRVILEDKIPGNPW